MRLYTEYSGRRAASSDPLIWDFDQEKIAYMEQIRSVDDLLNFYSTRDGRMEALAFDCALAMGLSRHDAKSVAGDI